MPPTLSPDRAVRPATLLEKVGLTQPTVERRVPSFRAAMKAGIETYYGSLKVAALTFHVDDSQLLKEWAKGNFLRYDEHADAEAKAFVSAYVDAALGQGHDPKLRAKALLRDMRARLDEFDACLERLL